MATAGTSLPVPCCVVYNMIPFFDPNCPCRTPLTSLLQAMVVIPPVSASCVVSYCASLLAAARYVIIQGSLTPHLRLNF